MNSLVGVVILNYNDAPTVLQLYELIKNYESIHHIVIVDNYSTDDSYQVLQEHCDSRVVESKTLSCNCHVIKTEKNGGYAYGNNVGARYLIENCNCDYIIISNPDVMFGDDYVRHVVNELENNPQIGIMSGVMLDKEQNEARCAFGYIPSYWDAIWECFYLVRHYKMKWQRNKIDYQKKIIPVEVVWGSLFVISADVYIKIGGMDEGTFLYHEENILGQKIKNIGMTNAILTTEKYIHNHGVTISKGTDRLKRHIIGMESQLYFQKEYHQVKGLKQHILHMMIRYSVMELKMINILLRVIGR